MPRRPPKTLKFEKTETELFLRADGVRIAMRGHPGTPQAGTWVSLVPGWTVRDTPDFKEILLGFGDEAIH